MQKNMPKHARSRSRRSRSRPRTGRSWSTIPSATTGRHCSWFANQRAVEFHPNLFLGQDFDSPTHLVVDLDPPAGADSVLTVQCTPRCWCARCSATPGSTALAKTSGAKGVHVVVPLASGQSAADVAAATRAVAARAERLDPELTTTAFVVEERGGKVFLDSTRSGGATLVAAYSPRARTGVPVSMPVAWDDLAGVAPSDFTIDVVPRLLGDADPWTALMPPPQVLDPGLVEAGAHHPDRPGGGDARGQATGPSRAGR